MRSAWVSLHRVLGLAIAAFLTVAGLTGAVIAWDHEIDAWLNPAFYQSPANGEPQPPLQLADAFERAHRGFVVTYLPLAVAPGETLTISVEPAADLAPSAVAFNQVALDPVTGDVRVKRMWGAPSLSRENLLPFLYKLHYSMHVPARFGAQTGVWLMGLVGVVWVVDCFVALAISFPSLRAWRKSLTVRWRQGGFRRLFDVHRSGGVWLWPLMLTVAVTSVSMNLEHEVVRPIVGAVSPLTPSAFDTPSAAPLAPTMDRRAILDAAIHGKANHGIDAPPGALFYSPRYGVYGVGFFAPGAEHGVGGLGNPWLYFDGRTGALVSADIPGEGSAGDVFMQAQFPLHSGRIAGVFGRIVVSVLGLAVATLSISGVVIWARKRAARRRRLATSHIAAA